LTFDLLTNLQRSGTNHAEDQPAHLRIKTELQDIPKTVSLQDYGGPEQRFCPAAVYEYVDDNDATDEEEGKKKLVINAQVGLKGLKQILGFGVCPVWKWNGTDTPRPLFSQNCVHCKCCSIKMPQEYIDWTVPEGGGGPQYQVM
jgi:electron-transferring-flavoprotein dehydrogenase